MMRKIEKLAYDYFEGDGDFPTLVFLPGFRSDKRGLKALYLMEKARARRQSCLLLDYSGHGESEGRFEDGTIGKWREDATKVINEVTQGPLLLVGSSMGGWIALKIALNQDPRLMDNIIGVVGIAAAPDFTRSISARLSAAQRARLSSDGFFSVPSEYGDDMIFTKKLLEDGENEIILDCAWPLSIPVALVQGKRDADVPWDTAEKIRNALPDAPVEIIYVEDGDHRLSREADLRLIDETVERMSVFLHIGGG